MTGDPFKRAMCPLCHRAVPVMWEYKDVYGLATHTDMSGLWCPQKELKFYA